MPFVTYILNKEVNVARGIRIFPAGTRVIYRGGIHEIALRDVVGTVMAGPEEEDGYLGSYAHVDWGGEFAGHTVADHGASHTGHCWYTSMADLQIVDEGNEDEIEEHIMPGFAQGAQVVYNGDNTGRQEAFRGLIGTVLNNNVGPRNAITHVNWPAGFEGHDRLPAGVTERDGHTNHCYYVGTSELRLARPEDYLEEVRPMAMPPEEVRPGYAEGFPEGCEVVALGDRAGGSHYNRLSAGIRGRVIANVSGQRHPLTHQLYVHVTFPGIEGHRRVTTTMQHTGECLFMLPTEIRRMGMTALTTDELAEALSEGAVQGPSNIPTEIPRLRVIVNRTESQTYRGTENVWQFQVLNGPTPTKFEVESCMDKAIVRRIGTRVFRSHDLNGIITRGIDTYGIDPSVFVDAITTAALQKQARESTGVFERLSYDSDLSKAMATEPAIIAIGDMIFTLQPRGAVKAGKAMGAIRERITGAATKLAKNIKDNSVKESAALIKAGEEQLARARRQIEQERAANKNVLIIPEWIVAYGIPVRKNVSGSSVYPYLVGMEIPTRIVEFQCHYEHLEEHGSSRDRNTIMETLRWPAVKAFDEYVMQSVQIWIPVSFATWAYDYKNAKIISTLGYPWMTPHLGSDRCCMDLQGMPSTMPDKARYEAVRLAITRGMERVNLNSLLHGLNSWHPQMAAQVPPIVKKVIDEAMCIPPDADEIGWFGNYPMERTTVKQEGSQTFELSVLHRARVEAGHELPVIYPMPEGGHEDETEDQDDDEADDLETDEAIELIETDDVRTEEA